MLLAVLYKIPRSLSRGYAQARSFTVVHSPALGGFSTKLAWRPTAIDIDVMSAESFACGLQCTCLNLHNPLSFFLFFHIEFMEWSITHEWSTSSCFSRSITYIISISILNLIPITSIFQIVPERPARFLFFIHSSFLYILFHHHILMWLEAAYCAIWRTFFLAEIASGDHNYRTFLSHLNSQTLHRVLAVPSC